MFQSSNFRSLVGLGPLSIGPRAGWSFLHQSLGLFGPFLWPNPLLTFGNKKFQKYTQIWPQNKPKISQHHQVLPNYDEKQKSYICIHQALSHVFRFARRSNYKFLEPNQLMKIFFAKYIGLYSSSRPAQLGGVPARTQASQAGSVEQTEAMYLAKKKFH